MADADREGRLRRGGLAFFGRMSASISHELNNSVSTIGEVAGLLEDLCQLAEGGRPITPERLRRQCDMVSRQTERAQQIIKGMNYFAHSVDEEETTFDLGGEARSIVTLTERLAGIKGYRFDVAGTDAAVSVRGKRFLLNELLFVLFSTIFESGARDGSIEVRVGLQGGSALVTVAGAIPEGASPDADRMEYATFLAEDLGGAVESATDADHRAVFAVRLPAAG